MLLLPLRWLWPCCGRWWWVKELCRALVAGGHAVSRALGASIPFRCKPRPRASARLWWPPGWQRARSSRSCQLCRSMSPWRCHLKGRKAHFSKTQVKIALSYSACPFPVCTRSLFADCKDESKDRGALPVVAGRGRAGAWQCHQANPCRAAGGSAFANLCRRQ